MDYRKTLIAAAAVAMIPVAGTALANEGAGKSGATFDTLDTNRDGRISKAEAAADANLVFSSADANGDGYLDNAEFKKARKAHHDGSMPPQPQSSTTPSTDSATPDPSVPSDQSAPPPADTETPRQ
jgi:hypothetical protein